MNCPEPLSLTAAYLSVGSNVGNKIANIGLAIRRLGETEGISIKALSKFYKTAPQNYTDQDWFVNAAIKINTVYSPGHLLQVLQAIEKELDSDGKPLDLGRAGLIWILLFFRPEGDANRNTCAAPSPNA